jgi:hypothetical protein
VCWHYTLGDASEPKLTPMGGCGVVAVTLEGVASMDAFSVDAADNAGGNASRVTWTWDHSAPDTSVSVDGGVFAAVDCCVGCEHRHLCVDRRSE